MTTHIDILNIRHVLGRDEWETPIPHGPDGWMMLAGDRRSSVIVSYADLPDRAGWIHASRTGPDRVPTYEEMMQLHRAVWGDHGYSYQVQAPVAQHIIIHPFALHLWGRADGAPVLPEFGKILGSI